MKTPFTAALRLAAAYGQQRGIAIPACRKAREVLRNREIRAAYDMAEGSGMGMTPAALARRFNIPGRFYALVGEVPPAEWGEAGA